MSRIAGFTAIAAVFILAVIWLAWVAYGVILAVKLMRRGEKQWFFLPFICIPLVFVSKIIDHFSLAGMRPDELRLVATIGFSVITIVALLSGGAVYWLMRRYRNQTAFIHYYAAAYFLNAAGFAGLTAAVLAQSLAGVKFCQAMLSIIALYGFIVHLAGVAVMRGRLKLHKRAIPNAAHKNAESAAEAEAFPWQQI